MRHSLAILIAFCLLPATAAVAAPDPRPPAAVTGSAEAVGQTTATLTGTVDPNAAATTYRFEYGTSDDYGLQTVEQAAGDGDAATTVKLAIAALTPSTTYHYRLLARNAAGEVRGQDRTLKTAAAPANPSAPRIAGLGVQANSQTDPVVRASLNPRGAATTWHVELGYTSGLGRRTPDQTLPAGTKDVRVTATLPGLEPNRRVHWRVVATNAAGTTRSNTARFTTLRGPSAVTLELDPPVVTWSRPLVVRGVVAGAGVGGITVVLDRLAFPFGGPLAQVATTRADSRGRFSFPAGPLLVTTRFQARARLLASPVLTARSAVRVGASTRRGGRRRTRVTGSVWPALPNGRASLQKRSPRGRWVPVARQPVSVRDASRSRYDFSVARGRRPGVYRVAVLARDGGAHVRGTSRELTVRRRPR